MSQLKKFVDSVQKKLSKVEDKVDCPNAGGCAVIALSAYRYLERKFPEDMHKVSIVFLFTEGSFDENEEERLRNNQAGSCSHCMLRISEVGGERYIDCEGDYTWDALVDDYGFARELAITPAQCLCAINYRSWNTVFEREESLPIITKIFGKGSTEGINKDWKIKDKPCPDQK